MSLSNAVSSLCEHFWHVSLIIPLLVYHYRKANTPNTAFVWDSRFTRQFFAKVLVITTTIPFVYPHHSPMRERDVSPIFMVMQQASNSYLFFFFIVVDFVIH